jgi:SP family myo-inositol transporter-like MFS transporter 13
MLGLAGVPSLVMFCGLLFMPETPRWLVFHDKIPRARKSLCHLREPKEAEQELQDIIKDYQEYKAHKLAWWQVVVKLFTTRSVRLALVVGCGLQMFQQFGGINTVMYYSASIIQMAGFPDRDAIWLAAIPAFGNFIFTILGLILVDRIGRRKLILGSSAGVILSLALLGAAFYAVDVDSPEATPRQRDHCDLTSCGACVGNSQCGFCVDHVDDGSFVNGTCTPAEEINGEMMSKYRTVNRTCLLYFETTPTDMRYSTSKLFDSEFDTEFDTWPGSNSSSSDRERRWFFTSCPNSKLASLTIVVLFIYIAFFAPGMGPLPWTINAEIYPTWARSTAIAIATTVNWLCNLIVSMTFLTLTDRYGPLSL